ncbi:MAG: Rieske 2Fe-2S domain-containing protein [Alphaproteobacteria bacterium]
MAADGTQRPQGTAYGRQMQTPIDLLTKVGPGTPCGEFMRRYWQPVLAARNVTNRPKEIRILGEDLIVFRDKSGRPGLLYPRCMHRGTTLFYGRVEERGIRCCYHGWLFDVEGNCLEQPCEPNGGTETGRKAARQPWYPVAEKYGMVWAYMGPPDKMPALPTFDNMELEPGESYRATDQSLGSHGDPNGPQVVPYSWLHMNDNVMDPFHVQQLHTTMSVVQFVQEFEVMPTVDFRYISNGVIYDAYRKLKDGREMNRISTWMLPNIMSVPSVLMEAKRSTGLGFSVPVDDTHSRICSIQKVSPVPPTRRRGFEDIKPWSEMTMEEHQDIPGDYEAQAGQGPVSLHSEEHLATSDRGVAMQRRMIEQQIKTVVEGGDPLGVFFDEKDAVIHVPSGNFFKQ